VQEVKKISSVPHISQNIVLWQWHRSTQVNGLLCVDGVRGSVVFLVLGEEFSTLGLVRLTGFEAGNYSS